MVEYFYQEKAAAPVRVPDRIETEADLAACLPVLCDVAPVFATILDRVGPLPLRRRADGFAALAQAIVGQQVSTASAAAIWGRMEAAGICKASTMQAASDADLQAVGLSRPKQRYLRALADARLDYAGLRTASSDTVIATLVAQKGIGRWTAEIYAMFALGHTDVFAAGDLALQEAVRRLFDLPARPSEAALRDMARDWAPVRAVAARALWAYYRIETKREGAL